jgi:hypothetical protein
MKTHVIEAIFVGRQCFLYSSEAIAERELCKSHRQKLVTTRQMPDSSVAAILVYTYVQLIAWQMIHNLSEYDPALVHDGLLKCGFHHNRIVLGGTDSNRAEEYLPVTIAKYGSYMTFSVR